MLEVTSIDVRTYDLDFLDLFWEIKSTDEELSHYEFYVLRSLDGPAGPFSTVAGPFFNTYMLRDPSVHQIHNLRQYYYKLRVVDRRTQESAEYGPAYLAAPPDLIAIEVMRRQRLLYQEFAGRKALLYPALTFGQRCAHCWDRNALGNSIGRSKQQNCMTCFDTTFVGGYASPILIDVQIDPNTIATQRTDEGERQMQETTARCAPFPPVKPRDMIVEAENKRWYVEQRTSTEKLRAVVRQELKLRQYQKGDVKYKVPVNLDLLFQSSPAREFTRPHTVETREQTLPPKDIIGDL